MSQPDRVRVWEHAMHRENFRASKWSCVCSTHFTADCFNRTGQTVRLKEGESFLARDSIICRARCNMLWPDLRSVCASVTWVD